MEKRLFVRRLAFIPDVTDAEIPAFAGKKLKMTATFMESNGVKNISVKRYEIIQ